MKRLEIVQLRLSRPRPSGLVRELRRQAAASGESEGLSIYRHSTVASDLGIHLRFEMDEHETAPSDLGHRLAEMLREHGMVEHTVWIEAEEEDDDE